MKVLKNISHPLSYNFGYVRLVVECLEVIGSSKSSKEAGKLLSGRFCYWHAADA